MAEDKSSAGTAQGSEVNRGRVTVAVASLPGWLNGMDSGGKFIRQDIDRGGLVALELGIRIINIHLEQMCKNVRGHLI